MKKSNNAGFSIIEILVGIFIFTLGLLSIFLMLQGSVNMNERSKSEIIASNLAREAIELVKNTRDTNFAELTFWDLINPNVYSGNKFVPDSYYMIENDFSDSQFPVKTTIINNFQEGKNELAGKMKDYRLYLDNKSRYVYAYNETDRINKTPTPFYRYIKVEKATYDDFGTIREVQNALRITSKVIWTTKGYHSVEVRTIITNWKKL